jgi:2-polyprenyl-3-methyl-5-hydroxy-6-metoxy-1,4-benzoquinol methylase
MIGQEDRVVAECIVCGGAATKVRDWTRNEIERAYSKIVGSPFPNQIPRVDYQICACSGCGILFADPPVVGDGAFYEWIVTAPNYYLGHRWEWGRVAETLLTDPNKKLLEIGCGSGNFLDYVAKRSGVEAIGLDTSPAAIAQCQKRQLSAYCQTLEQFTAEHDDAEFDLVCAFHCLEHVAHPKSLLLAMKRVLAPNGRVVVSVPYSPTIDEAFGWDCLNLPPHHLTRWNRSSLDRLAALVGMSAQIETERSGLAAVSTFKAAFWTFLASTGGSRGAVANLCRALAHPIKFAKLARFMVRRDRIDGKLAGNIALAVFRLPDG